jgi:hypothetical protein
MATAARTLKLRLLMAVDPALVSVTRRYVHEALGRFVNDGDLVSRVAMAAHELLENAAKYADQSNADLSITLDDVGGERRITLRLSNDASDGHLTRLRHLVSELDGCSDPYLYYLELVRRNAAARSASGVGLARIVVEAQMKLGVSVSGQTATIVAHTPVQLQHGG